MAQSQYAKGYQAAMQDIQAALDNGGIERVIAWLAANNSTPQR